MFKFTYIPIYLLSLFEILSVWLFHFMCSFRIIPKKLKSWTFSIGFLFINKLGNLWIIFFFDMWKIINPVFECLMITYLQSANHKLYSVYY